MKVHVLPLTGFLLPNSSLFDRLSDGRSRRIMGLSQPVVTDDGNIAIIRTWAEAIVVLTFLVFRPPPK